MNREEEYVNFEKPTEFVDVKVGGCRFGGGLYERKAGGFDLYLSLEHTDTDSLEQGKFNLLYDQADEGQEVFIERFAEPKLSRHLRAQAKERLKGWLERMLGAY